MNNFFDKLKGDKKKEKKNFQNPFAAVGKSLQGQRKFGGDGQSLGGTKPGRLIPISLDQPGQLGLKIEKRPNSQGTAIVAMVVPGGQADTAGLLRGDILCHPGSNGDAEIMYDQFIAMAASDQRPLVFEVRRIDSKAKSPSGNTSAEAESRKKAVIAAAEAREKAHKAKLKPIAKKGDSSLQPSRKDVLPPQQGSAQPMSEEAKHAIEAAKTGESNLAAELGFNPYSADKARGGQARTATVAMTHGTISDSAQVQGAQVAAPGPVAAPPVLSVAVSEQFEDALTTLATTNSAEAVRSSLGIMRKLIVNATTKGQDTADETSAAKFRKVRLSNAKIKASITEVNGALDVMMSVGFQLAEEDGESFLVYPPCDNGPEWLPSALKQMQQVESSA